MTGGSAVAKSYARALFELAKERTQTQAIGEQLHALAGLVTISPDLRDFFSRPWIAAGKKRAVAVELATGAGVSPLARDFFALVVAQRRAEHLSVIAEAYRELHDADRGRIRARVRTAVPLTEQERVRLAARLGRELGGKQVILEEAVDSALLGGFVAEIGSLVMDGSLDGQLARLRERLTAG
ncbi:MAG: ATP synthase F1 subunit delta [Candidatus Rokubacteria bacterium]|nr:ATP synthase F1 subunit delta [Candidatus Rokubacteria bacterium]